MTHQVKKVKTPTEKVFFIRLVRSNEKGKGSTNKQQQGLLVMTKDWKIEVDLDKKLIFPTVITSTAKTYEADLVSFLSSSLFKKAIVTFLR